MIKHITRIGITILAIAILIIIIPNHGKDDKVKIQHDQSIHATQIQPKEKAPRPHNKIELFIDREINEDYRVDAFIPITNNDQMNNEIETWIESEKATFISELSEDSQSQASLKIEPIIETESKHYSRLIFQIDKEIKPGEHIQQEKVFHVDLEEEKMLTLDNFLDVNDHVRQSVLKHALELVEKEEQITIEENTRQDILTSNDQWEWMMSQDGLTFIFDGAIIPETKQVPIHTTVPLQSLYLHMHDDFTHYVQLSEAQQKERDTAIQEEKERILAEKRAREKREQEKAQAKQEQEQAINSTDGKYIALTFDDGPSDKVTPRILDTLKQYNAKATFFMLGSQVDYHPEIAKLVADAGHEIGNHTDHHQDLTKLGPDAIRKEINSTSDKINNTTGVRPYLVRPPYGAYNDHVRNDAANHGNSIVLWSVDSLDWQSRNADAINREIQQQLTPGAIVLMHDIHPTTADALPKLLETLQQEGYQFVTVSQLLKIQESSGAGPFYGKTK